MRERITREQCSAFDGLVLDGWHRYQACESIGVALETIEFEGDEEAAEQFVCDKHTRRALTATQRVAAVMAMTNWRQTIGRPSNNRPPGGRNNQLPDSRFTVADLAKKANTSSATVKRFNEAVAIAPVREKEMRDGHVSVRS